jgi:hypothetical protein
MTNPARQILEQLSTTLRQLSWRGCGQFLKTNEGSAAATSVDQQMAHQTENARLDSARFPGKWRRVAGCAFGILIAVGAAAMSSVSL